MDEDNVVELADVRRFVREAIGASTDLEVGHRAVDEVDDAPDGGTLVVVSSGQVFHVSVRELKG